MFFFQLQGLGFVLKDLAKRSDLPSEIRNKALAIRKKWKDFHKNLLLAQKLDVKCDKPTTEKRETSKRILYNSLYDSNNNNNDENGVQSAKYSAKSTKADNLEFYIFQHCDHLVNSKYLSIVQKCKTLFSENEDIVDLFTNGIMKPEEVLHKAVDYSTSKSIYF
jgi:hypothetical protein